MVDGLLMLLVLCSDLDGNDILMQVSCHGDKDVSDLHEVFHDMMEALVDDNHMDHDDKAHSEVLGVALCSEVLGYDKDHNEEEVLVYDMGQDDVWVYENLECGRDHMAQELICNEYEALENDKTHEDAQ